MKRSILLVSLAIFVSMSAVWADEVKLDQSFEVDAGGTLYVRSDQGSIEVSSHSSNTVAVLVESRGRNADKFEVEVEQRGNDIRIVGKKQNSFWGDWGGGAKFTITVPARYNVELRTGGGSISLADLNGSVEAFTSGGSIDLGKIEGDVEVKTSGGSIRVEDVAGNIDAHTSGGSVSASISKQPVKDCRLTTSGGSIKVRLAENIAVDLSASTSGGRVRSEFDVDGSVNKTSIKGEINGGGPDLYLNTSGGSVSVNKL